jgi:hypothetical protein
MAHGAASAEELEKFRREEEKSIEAVFEKVRSEQEGVGG